MVSPWELNEWNLVDVFNRALHELFSIAGRDTGGGRGSLETIKTELIINERENYSTSLNGY